MKNDNRVAGLLKEASKQAHLDTERTLLKKLKAISTVGEYGKILSLFYGYYQPIEQAVQQYISAELLPDIKTRQRSRFILHDLQILQVYHEAILAEDLPIISSTAQAAGALYVLEGSTLGGQYIVKMLQQNPALQQHQHAIQFFDGYKDQNELMWDQFKQALDLLVQTDEEQELAEKAAIETFTKMNHQILKAEYAWN
ncbi:biliverdin-producing heme oxygenase [Aridibaculum aurantiacum]|uniref:biliverdin-producing heme oxygenase n=1 Tax=Aridibaculum aurantiacum TaxID=2810307 RepID=UPI001A969199|nr:biliverdin-producing heme oxygenase [Aridibaculum aurantiacum]